MSKRQSLVTLAKQLEDGATSSRQLVEEALARIADPNGEGARAFIRLRPDVLRAAADAQDQLRKAARATSRFAGIPFAVKDLFDVAGEVTTAGSKVLRGEAPATADSDAVSRLKGQGLIPLGRTNMTEFAYSGVGLNPHYGTPLSIYDRKTGRIPGGSSSGTAVAIAEGMCVAGLGTDTGGSCRIPAAFNGIVGYKPSAQRVSKRGVFPLSETLDSIGPLANTVADCAWLDAVLAGKAAATATPASGKLRIGVLKTYVLDDLDGHVAADFARSLKRLEGQGHSISDVALAGLEELPSLLANGGLVAAEAWKLHQHRIEAREAEYDPRVASRMRFGARITPEGEAETRVRRAALIRRFAEVAASFDVIACPTVPVIPPAVAALAEEADYRRINGQCLRNTYVFNFLDACAISLPMQAEGAAPTGLMLARPNGGDAGLFAAAEAVYPSH